jgi:allantoate deiminase
MVMLFVRDRGGVSHSPLEYVAPQDVAAAAAALAVYLQDQLLLT